jgi:hypothetical protein
VEAKKQRAADLESARVSFNGRIASAKKRITELQEKVTDGEKRFARGEWITLTLGQQVEQVGEGTAPCLLCSQSAQPQALLAKVAPLVEARRQSLQEDRASLAAAQAELSAAQQELASWQQKVAQDEAERERTINELTHWYGQITSRDDALQTSLMSLGAPASYTGLTAAEVKKQIDALEAADRAAQKLEDDTGRLRDLKKRRDMAKLLEGETKVLIDQCIAGLKETAEAAVNKYMPANERAVLDTKKHTWTVIGKDGRPQGKHTMCDFEMNSLVPAIASAYTDGAALRVATLDDRELAGVGLENCRSFFAALKHAVDQGWITQVFVAGNRLEPVLEQLAADGWNLIRTDDGPVFQVVGQLVAGEGAPTQVPQTQLFLDDGVPGL